MLNLVRHTRVAGIEVLKVELALAADVIESGWTDSSMNADQSDWKGMVCACAKALRKIPTWKSKSRADGTRVPLET